MYLQQDYNFRSWDLELHRQASHPALGDIAFAIGAAVSMSGHEHEKFVVCIFP